MSRSRGWHGRTTVGNTGVDSPSKMAGKTASPMTEPLNGSGEGKISLPFTTKLRWRSVSITEIFNTGLALFAGDEGETRTRNRKRLPMPMPCVSPATTSARQTNLGFSSRSQSTSQSFAGQFPPNQRQQAGRGLARWHSPSRMSLCRRWVAMHARCVVRDPAQD